MGNARRKALAAVWIQWGSFAALALAAIPPAALLFRAHECSVAVAHNRLTLEAIGIFGSIAVVGIFHGLVFRSGCFGVCDFPPLMPLRPGVVFWCRLVTHGLFVLAVAAVTLTILGSVPLNLGLVVCFGLLSLYVVVFRGLCLALGYGQIVPSRLRFFFAGDTWWMGRNIRRHLYDGECSCVAALKHETLTLEEQLLAMELIALRPWVPGGIEALRELAHAEGRPAPLAARAREILANQTSS